MTKFLSSIFFPNQKKELVLKGAFFHHYFFDFLNSWLGLQLDIFQKNSGIKEVDETSSDKARKRIAIVAKLNLSQL